MPEEPHQPPKRLPTGAIQNTPPLTFDNWFEYSVRAQPHHTDYWHYKQWREAGAIEQLMSVLHGQVREEVKKKPSGRR